MLQFPAHVRSVFGHARPLTMKRRRRRGRFHATFEAMEHRVLLASFTEQTAGLFGEVDADLVDVQYNNAIEQNNMLNNFGPISDSSNKTMIDPYTGATGSFSVAINSQISATDVTSGSVSMSSSFNSPALAFSYLGSNGETVVGDHISAMTDTPGVLTVHFTTSSSGSSNSSIDAGFQVPGFPAQRASGTYVYDKLFGAPIIGYTIDAGISSHKTSGFDPKAANAQASISLSWTWAPTVVQHPVIAMNSVALSPDGQSVNASYMITGVNLPAPGTIDFYWASGPNLTNKLGSPVPIPTKTAVGSYTASLPISKLGPRPSDATYILAVADSPNADPDHNVASVQVQQPDIAMDSAYLTGQNESTINFTYHITGDPGPFTAGFYLSADHLFDSTDTLIASQVVTPAANSSGAGSFKNVLNFTPSPSRPYLLVVADPQNIIAESDERNNVTVLPPQIKIDNLPVNRIFYISDDVIMPTIHLELIGIAPDQNTSLSWSSKVVYTASQYPPIKGIRGSGRNMSFTYPSVLNTSPTYTPDFRDQTGKQVVRGGTLILSVTATIDGQQRTFSTPASGTEAVKVEGTNPTQKMVHDYVANIDVPDDWPSNTQYDFHTIIRKIISDESSPHVNGHGNGQIRQFYQGIPLWSQDNLHGAGFMQLTNPPPSDDEVWDWHKNIKQGVAVFEQKLETAINRLDGRDIRDRNGRVIRHIPGLFDQVQSEAAQVGANAAPITGDMIVLEAIRGFNGYDNGAGIIDEWQPVRDASGQLVIHNGLTSWEQVPAADRIIGVPSNKIKGEPDYVNSVLSSADF